MRRALLTGAMLLSPALFAPPAPAQTAETVLYSFRGGDTDGAFPLAGLVADTNGNLFGSTAQGGPAGGSGCKSGCGIIFELSASSGYASETILHTFAGGPADGAVPLGNLIIDAAGNLYGTTSEGGAGTLCNGNGCGTVFELTGTSLQILYSFKGGIDGQVPMAGLVMDQQGNLYGTSAEGGVGGCGYFRAGCGIIFEISAAGKETPLYAFNGSSHGDGEAPRAALIVDDSGSLFGTTMSGGILDDSCVFESCGTVFELASGATTDVVLYGFKAGSDGANPFSTLAMDSAGILTGTTLYGGSKQKSEKNCLTYGCGTVFQLDSGNEKRIPFTAKEGGAPEAGLVSDGKGNLYGVACGTECNGGSAGRQCSKGCNYGTVFEFPSVDGMKKPGSLKIKYGFRGATKHDGSFPAAPLLFINGNYNVLYGTTQNGGTGKCLSKLGCGTVFSIKLSQARRAHD